jgi:hypothetical protein
MAVSPCSTIEAAGTRRNSAKQGKEKRQKRMVTIVSFAMVLLKVFIILSSIINHS